MVDTAHTTDAGIGLSFVFGAVALLAAFGTFATSYVAMLNEDHGMQVLSGVALAVSVGAAGLAVAAVHLFGD